MSFKKSFLRIFRKKACRHRIAPKEKSLSIWWFPMFISIFMAVILSTIAFLYITYEILQIGMVIIGLLSIVCSVVQKTSKYCMNCGIELKDNFEYSNKYGKDIRGLNLRMEKLSYT